MRSDGKLVTDVTAMYRLFPYITPERNDSQNMINISCDYNAVHDYVNKKRKEGIKLSHMSVVLAAYVRTVSQHPFLNRFVVNCKVYAHNTLTTAMVVLRPGDKNETMGKIKFDLNDTIFDVDQRLVKYVEENAQADSNNSLDKLMKALLAVPGLVRFAIWLFKKLDKLGLLPKAIMDASPFHESMVFTNLASIKTNYIYHHIYNFGTCNAILAMGNTVDKPRIVKGEQKLVKEIPFGLVMDERIGSGYEFAMAFADLKNYLEHPELLENPPEELKYDFPFPTLSSRFPTKQQIKEAKKAEKAKK